MIEHLYKRKIKQVTCDNRAADELKFIGEWVSRETSQRRYTEEEIKTLSSALIYVRDYINNKSKKD